MAENQDETILQSRMSTTGQEYTFADVKKHYDRFYAITKRFREYLERTGASLNHQTLLTFELWIGNMEEYISRMLNQWQRTKEDDLVKYGPKLQKAQSAASKDAFKYHVHSSAFGSSFDKKRYTWNVKHMYCIFDLKTQEFRDKLEQERSGMKSIFQYLTFEEYIQDIENGLTKTLDQWQVTENIHDKLWEEENTDGVPFKQAIADHIAKTIEEKDGRSYYLDKWDKLT